MKRPNKKSTSAGSNEETERREITRRALLRAGWAIPVILVIAPPESIAQLGTAPEEPPIIPPGGSSGSSGSRGRDGEEGGVGIIGGGGGSPGGGSGGQSGPGGYNSEEELFDLE